MPEETYSILAGMGVRGHVGTFKSDKKKYYVLEGSSLAEGLLRKEFVFTRKELQKAAKRSREMKKHIASEFEKATFMPMKNWRGRGVMELAQVLAFQKKLDRNRARRR